MTQHLVVPEGQEVLKKNHPKPTMMGQVRGYRGLAKSPAGQPWNGEYQSRLGES